MRAGATPLQARPGCSLPSPPLSRASEAQITQPDRASTRRTVCPDSGQQLLTAWWASSLRRPGSSDHAAYRN